MRSVLEVYDLPSGTSTPILQTNALIEAPNWDPTGAGFLVNSAGRLYRVPRDQPRLVPVDTGDLTRCNNDHGFSPDGQTIAFCSHRDNGAEMFLMPARGGPATLQSPQAPSWFHGWHPKGHSLTYVAARGGKRVIDVYTKALNGPESRLTNSEGQCDGPDFSADGRHIFYNCDRSGHAQIWVMDADGANQRQLFADDHVNWFPHPSPDGAHVLYLAYPPGTQGHPRDLPVHLVLMHPDGTHRRRILSFIGGQGTINVPSWSPDGRAFAYIRYAPPQ